MKLVAHKLHDLSELTLSCINSITNMALFINLVTPDLRHYAVE
jgi:hypothetical protein